MLLDTVLNIQFLHGRHGAVPPLLPYIFMVWCLIKQWMCCVLYASSKIIMVIKSRKMRWAGQVLCMGEMRNSYRILVRKPEGKRPLGRPRQRWEGH
jgi:hypothetical protein